MFDLLNVNQTLINGAKCDLCVGLARAHTDTDTHTHCLYGFLCEFYPADFLY